MDPAPTKTTGFIKLCDLGDIAIPNKTPRPLSHPFRHIAKHEAANIAGN